MYDLRRSLQLHDIELLRVIGESWGADLVGLSQRAAARRLAQVMLDADWPTEIADLSAEEQAAVQAISPDGVESKAGKNYSDAQLYLDIAGVMFVVISDTQKVTLINRKGCEILGYRESEIIGQNWFENFLPEHIRHQAAEVFHRLMNGELEPVEYFENPVLTRNGEERLIAWHNTVIRDKQGLPLATLSSGTDVTEQKLAQAELERYKAHLEDLVEKRTAQLKTTNKRLEKEISERKRTEQAFLESQVRFAGILDTATEAVISIDEDQRIMLFNKGAENTFGYRADEAIGRSLDILLPEVRDDTHRRFIADVAALRFGEEKADKRYTGRCVPVGKSVIPHNKELLLRRTLEGGGRHEWAYQSYDFVLCFAVNHWKLSTIGRFGETVWS